MSVFNDDFGHGDDGYSDEGEEVGQQVVLQEDFDPTYEPSQEDIEDYAKLLGMDLVADKAFLWVAREGLKAPLPPDWKPCHDSRSGKDGEIYYFNFKTSESTWDHPCDEAYRKKFQEEKRKGAQKKAGGSSRFGGGVKPGSKSLLPVKGRPSVAERKGGLSATSGSRSLNPLGGTSRRDPEPKKQTGSSLLDNVMDIGDLDYSDDEDDDDDGMASGVNRLGSMQEFEAANDIEAYARISKASVQDLGSLDAAMDDASSDDGYTKRRSPAGRKQRRGSDDGYNKLHGMRDNVQALGRPSTSAGRGSAGALSSGISTGRLSTSHGSNKRLDNWDLGVDSPSPDIKDTLDDEQLSAQDIAQIKHEHQGKITVMSAKLKKEHEVELATVKATLQQTQEAKLAMLKAQIERDTNTKKSAAEAQSKAKLDKAEAEAAQRVKDTHAKADKDVATAAAEGERKLKAEKAKLKDAHEVELAKLKKAHATQLEAVRQVNQASIKKEKGGIDKQLADVNREMEHKLAKAKADAEAKLKAEVDKLDSETSQELSQLRKDKMDQAKIDLTAANEAELKRLRRSAEKEKEDARVKNKAELAELEADLKSKLDKEKVRIATEQAAETAKLQAQHKEEVLKVQAEIKAAQEVEKKKYGDELRAVKDAAATRADMDGELTKLVAEFEKEKKAKTESARKECEQELGSIRKTHSTKVTGLQAQNRDRLEKLEKELEATAEKHRARVQKDEEQKLQDLQREIQTLREECDREQRELKSELQQAKDRYEVSAAALAEDQAELDAKRADLDESSTKHAKIMADISSADGNISAKEGELAKLTTESAQLTEKVAEIKAEHEQALKKLEETKEALAHAQASGAHTAPPPAHGQPQTAWGPPVDPNNARADPPWHGGGVPRQMPRHIPQHAPQQAAQVQAQAHVPYMHVPYPLAAHLQPTHARQQARPGTNHGAASSRYTPTYSNNVHAPRGIHKYPSVSTNVAALDSDDEQLQWAQELVAQHSRQKSKKKANKVLREMRLQRKVGTSSVVDHDLLQDIKQILADSQVDNVDVDYVMSSDRHTGYRGDVEYSSSVGSAPAVSRPTRSIPTTSTRPNIGAKAAHTFDVWAANREHTARVLDHHADWLDEFRQSLHRSTLDISERVGAPSRTTMHYVSRSFLDKYDESI